MTDVTTGNLYNMAGEGSYRLGGLGHLPHVLVQVKAALLERAPLKLFPDPPVLTVSSHSHPVSTHGCFGIPGPARHDLDAVRVQGRVDGARPPRELFEVGLDRAVFRACVCVSGLHNLHNEYLRRMAALIWFARAMRRR